ncbi:hypothetical protein Hdeb2414_s0004g00125461 [Helianthus debilis subsp. tardiflorus]
MLEEFVDQICLYHNGKYEYIPVIVNRPAENPVSDAAIEFDMLVKVIWFLRRVQSTDGDNENR